MYKSNFNISKYINNHAAVITKEIKSTNKNPNVCGYRNSECTVMCSVMIKSPSVKLKMYCSWKQIKTIY